MKIERGVYRLADNFVIEMLHITKEFPGIKANDDVTLQLRKGEIHALVGENGAGKSTLMKMLFGMLAPTEGQIFVDGKEVHFTSSGDAIAAGLGMVHQHFMQVPSMTVAENLILGAENGSPFKVDRKKAVEITRELSERYNLKVEAEEKVEDISLAMRQKLEILKDSRVGAFAVLGCVSYLLLQYALWCQPGWEKEDLWVLALVPVLSRAMSGYGALTQPGARADGLLAAFTEQEQGRGRQRFLLFLCALLALAIGMLGVGCAAVAAAILVYLWYIQMARREFGGLTGDLAGWFLQVCELGCLAAMVLAREIAEVLI